MTNEDADLVARTIESQGIQFPICRVQGSATDSAYGVSGFPSSVLIDASGEIVWKGHPARLDDELIPPLLEDVRMVPELPRKYQSINVLVKKEQLGKAHRAIVKALERNPDEESLLKARETLESMATGDLQRGSEAEEAKDWGYAVEVYTKVAKLFDGMEEADVAESKQKAISKNPDARAELSAYKKFLAARKAIKKGDTKGGCKKLKALLKRLESGPTKERAEALLKRYPIYA